MAGRAPLLDLVDVAQHAGRDADHQDGQVGPGTVAHAAGDVDDDARVQKARKRASKKRPRGG